MNEIWHHILIPGPTLIEKIARPIIVYFALVLLLRIFGKRELAQLNPFDLVVLLSLSNTVQNAIIGDDNSVSGGLLGALALLFINWVVVWFLFKHRRLDQIVEGQPTELIKNGKILEKALAKEMLTLPELQTVAHRQGFGRLSDIKTCLLDPDGTFFITAKEPKLEEQQRLDMLRKLDELNAKVEKLSQLLAQRQG